MTNALEEFDPRLVDCEWRNFVATYQAPAPVYGFRKLFRIYRDWYTRRVQHPFMREVLGIEPLCITRFIKKK